MIYANLSLWKFKHDFVCSHSAVSIPWSLLQYQDYPQVKK